MTDLPLQKVQQQPVDCLWLILVHLMERHGNGMALPVLHVRSQQLRACLARRCFGLLVNDQSWAADGSHEGLQLFKILHHFTNLQFRGHVQQERIKTDFEICLGWM